MGLFDIFDKKLCDVCGEEIKLLGNKKLQDGNLCKNCANKLSPWFNDRRHSTIEEIIQQLEYRDANIEEVKDFKITRSMGKSTKVLVDENQMKFMVTGATDLVKANPDVLMLKDITDVRLNIRDSKTEIHHKDADKKMVSFTPARYAHSYSFSIEIDVNNPYFDNMSFDIANSIHLYSTTILDYRGPEGTPEIHIDSKVDANPRAVRPGARPGTMPARPANAPTRQRAPKDPYFDIPLDDAYDVQNCIEYIQAEELGYTIRDTLLQLMEEAKRA